MAGAVNNKMRKGGGGRRRRRENGTARGGAFSSLQRSNEGRKNAFFRSIHAFVTPFFAQESPRCALRVAPGGELER
jgi:hypothetical protein